MSKRGLGKGLDALLGGGGADSAAPAAAAKLAASEKIALNRLVAGKYQPRRRFDSAAMNTLADSIRQHGVIQPLVVRPLSGGRYEIIAGERRFRAAKLAGLTSVPVVRRQLSDQEAQIYALVENLQRADLNPIEQARGIARLIEEMQLGHAAVAEYVGLSRPAVSNLLRLLQLAGAVQKLVQTDQLAMGQARALLPLPKAQQEVVAKDVVAQSLTTRQTEQLVRRLLTGGSGKPSRRRVAADADNDTKRLERALSQKLAMRVDIQHRKNGSGKMTLHYSSAASLDTVLNKLK